MYQKFECFCSAFHSKSHGQYFPYFFCLFFFIIRIIIRKSISSFFTVFLFSNFFPFFLLSFHLLLFSHSIIQIIFYILFFYFSFSEFLIILEGFFYFILCFIWSKWERDGVKDMICTCLKSNFMFTNNLVCFNVTILKHVYLRSYVYKKNSHNMQMLSL